MQCENSMSLYKVNVLILFCDTNPEYKDHGTDNRVVIDWIRLECTCVTEELGIGYMWDVGTSGDVASVNRGMH